MKNPLPYCILIFQTTIAQVDTELLKEFYRQRPIFKYGCCLHTPFLGLGKVPVSIGGYAELNWQHISTDGVSEGHQFQLRRMTLFVSSSISSKIKFLSEIELEEGGKEINIEFAAIDVELNPLLNLRGGIIMNPIGLSTKIMMVRNGNLLIVLYQQHKCCLQHLATPALGYMEKCIKQIG